MENTKRRRIFDICYFLTELLAEETEDAYNVLRFIQNCESDIKSVI